MATTYSTDLGIKLIGTGLEAGTWGASTNQNFKRIEDTLGLAITLDLLNLASPSTSSNGTGQTPSAATWVTIGNADSDGTNSEAGGEPRACAVEFTGAIDAGAAITINIRGATSGTNVNRTYIVWNNLDNVTDLIIDCGGGSMTLKHGAYAMINLNPDGTGAWGDGASGAGVKNLLSNLQLDGIVFPAAATIDLTNGDGTILTQASSATALVVSDGTTSLLTVDSANEKVVLDVAGANTQLDLSGANTKPAVILLSTIHDNALKVQSNAAQVHLHADVTNAESIIGSVGFPVDLRVWGDVYVDDQASTLTVKTDEPAALTIADSAASLIVLDTTAVLPSVDVVPQLTAPDISITGADGYIEFGSENFDGATGIGIRNNSGSMEQNVDSSAAWNPIISALVGVDIAAVATQAIGAASSADGEEKMGCIDIGPMRLIFNTVAITNSVDIELGDDGSGTGAAMDAALWTVMLLDSDNTDTGANQNPSCTITGSAAGTFTIKVSSRTDHVTYWAIGDSGA